MILSNFRLHEDKTITLSDNNLITGANEVGKTSIYLAIEFCLFGTINGSAKIDREIKNGAERMQVTLFTDIGIFSRTKSRTGNSKPKMNEAPVKQEEINEAIGLDIKRFLASSKVGYYMSLDNATKRELLLGITSPVDKKEIFGKLVGDMEMADEMNIDFDDLKNETKRIKAQYKLLDSQQTMYLANRKLLNEQIVEAKAELKEMEVPKFDTEAAEKVYALYEKEIDSIKELGAERIKLQIELERIENKKQPLYDSRTKKEINAEIKATKEIIDKNKGKDICPTCKQPIRNEEVLSAESLYLSLCDELDIAETNIHIKKNNKELIKEEKEIKARLETLTAPDETELNRLRELTDKLEAEQGEYKLAMNSYKSKETQVKQLEERFKDNLKNCIENDLNKYKRASDALNASGILVEELKLKKEELNAKTGGKYTFEFLKPNKSGEGFQEVFEIYRNGVEFAQLSTGAQIRWNVNIARIIGKFYGSSLLFLDEGDRIDIDIKPLKGEQFICVKVARGKPLKVESL